MKALKKIVLFILISAVFVTCKKEVLTPSTTANQPIFSFSGTIGGHSYNWQAGVNNYYMYSSDTMNSQGVYGFTGFLRTTTSTYNSIQITINDYRVSASGSSVKSAHIDTALTQPLYSYSTPAGIVDSTYTITFTPIIYAGGAVQAYTYSFGDHTSNTISFNSTPVTHIYKSSGTYATSLTTKFTAYGLVTMSDTITILKTQPQLWLNPIQSTVGIVVNPDTVPVTFKGIIATGSTGPYTYSWNYNDGTTSSSSSSADSVIVNHTYRDSNPQIFPVYLKVTDHLGHSESYNYNFWADNTTYPGGLMDYKMSPPSFNRVSDSLSLSDVTITYTDNTGKVYTSKNNSQNGGTFQINSVSDYQNNINNYPTKMLKVTFSCWLYPVLGGTPIQATNCTATIAVAYH